MNSKVCAKKEDGRNDKVLEEREKELYQLEAGLFRHQLELEKAREDLET